MLKTALARSIGMAIGYIFWFSAIRLVVITLVAYIFVHSSDTLQKDSLQKVDDIIRANQVLTYGFSALTFVLLLHAMHPLTRTSWKGVFNLQILRENFLRNALGGAILASVLVLGTALGGHMSYLGIYLKFDEVALSMANVALFSFGLFMMAIVEEYILRQAIEPKLEQRFGNVGVAVVSCAIFLLIKYNQFDLTTFEVLNFCLLNLTLSMIAKTERTYMASASFSGVFSILLHVVFGLPILGQDMPGLFLLRPASDEGLGALLSGGARGPEASLVLTLLLTISLYLPQIRSKKIEV